jgi:hypothetical protein
MGEAAVKAGLADTVASFEDAIRIATGLGQARIVSRPAGATTMSKSELSPSKESPLLVEARRTREAALATQRQRDGEPANRGEPLATAASPASGLLAEARRSREATLARRNSVLGRRT